MAKYEVKHDRTGCIGCGACVSACPKYWEMASDGKSKFKGKNPLTVDIDCNKQAAAACPVNVITVKEL